MNIESITVLILIIFVTLLVLGLPMAFTMGGTAIIISLILWSPDALTLAITRIFHVLNGYIFVAIPMFIFMGCMLQQSGAIEDLFRAMHLWLGPLRGGLASATVLTCTMMAAMTGIIGASIVTMGITSLPQMLKRRYNKSIATGCIMAGGSLGTLIPPSITFIVYGITAELSVGKLFAGGLFPGLLLATLFIAYISLRSFINPEMGPAMPKAERTMPFGHKLSLAKYVILPCLLIVTVLGSIYAGIATPTEASGLGSLGAIIVAAIHRRLSLQSIREAAITTMKITGMILWIVFAAFYIIGVYSLAGGAKFAENTILGLELGPWGTVIIMQVLFIVAGMFLESIGILLLAIPICAPVIVGLGFDPIWFGVIFVMNMQLSYLTPPFGPAMFYMKGVAPQEISMTDLYRAIGPFLGLQLLGMIIVMISPQIATWLPNILYK